MNLYLLPRIIVVINESGSSWVRFKCERVAAV